MTEVDRSKKGSSLNSRKRVRKRKSVDLDIIVLPPESSSELRKKEAGKPLYLTRYE